MNPPGLLVFKANVLATLPEELRSLAQSAKESAWRVSLELPGRGDGYNPSLCGVARAWLNSGITADNVIRIIEALPQSRNAEAGEVARAVAAVEGNRLSLSSGRPTRWPKPDYDLILRVARDRPVTKERLTEMSPVDPTAVTSWDAIDQLFPPQVLLWAGETTHDRRSHVWPKEQWREWAHEQSFICASPMTAKTGKSKQGQERRRTLDNTGPIHWLVIETDFKRPKEAATMTVQSNEKCKFLRRAESELGMTGSDIGASVIWHLRERWPVLALVVFSGSVSCHGWFEARGFSSTTDPDGQALTKFRRYAAMCGADPATFTRCQPVRMPGGVRRDCEGRCLLGPDGTLIKQTILYFDANRTHTNQ